MIQITETPFRSSDLELNDSIEKIILQRINDSATAYSYASITELSFEIKLRKNIIMSAKSMNSGDAKFAVFKTSRCNPKYWTLTNVGGFQLLQDVKPSDAIEDIYSNSSKYAFECATAMVIIYYHAFLKLIGADLFNQLFKDIYLYSWHADANLGLTAINTQAYIPGDVIYFNNPEFNPDTPQWRGENAVLLEDDTYFGHGIGIHKADQIIHALNQNRKADSQKSAYLTNIVVRPSFKPYPVFNNQPIVAHHNFNSISYGQYAFI